MIDFDSFRGSIIVKRHHNTKKYMSIKALSDYTFYSRYARYNKDKKRRESWEEAVGRVFDMHRKKYSTQIQENPELGKLIDFAQSMQNKKRVLSAQRSLQFAGDPIFKHSLKMFNCFDRNTEFVTTTGVKSFEDFEDGEKVQVFGHSGEIKNAVVRNYGKSNFNEIQIKRGQSVSYTYKATKNHRWLLKSGETTEDLKVGDYIMSSIDRFSQFDFNTAEWDEKLYWCYGMIFGDGSVIKNNNIPAGSLIRLCGYDKKYNERFEEMGFKSSSPHSIGDDTFFFTRRYFKLPPDPTKDEPRLIKAFVRGYLDADGNKDNNCTTPNKFWGMVATGEKHYNFVRKCFPIAGVYIVSEKDISGEVTNKGVRGDCRLFQLRNSFDRDDKYRQPFRVVSIKENVSSGDAWCLEVEDDKSFTLPNGMVTGNCLFSHIDRPRVFQEIMYSLLCGCGVGFSVQTHHVDILPEITPTSKPSKKYTIEDSIEGWADAIGVLMDSYFCHMKEFKDYHGHEIEFDFSEIRPEGDLIAGQFKAPGPNGLRESLLKINNLIQSRLNSDSFKVDRFKNKLRPIDCYDILMFTSDAVLSGGVRRCLAKGSKVLIKNSSYKNIEDVVIGDLVSTNDGWMPVTNTFEQGFQKTITINHQDGSLKCTPNHRVAVLTDIVGGFKWKHAGDLVAGDRLFFVDNINDSEFIDVLPNFKYEFPKNSTTCKDIVIPELTEDIAWLLGEIQGDGYVRLTESSGDISVAVEGTCPEKAIKISEVLQKFGVNTSIQQPRETYNCYKVKVESKQLAQYFHSWLKKPKETLTVPECIKVASPIIKAAYLQGILDADGCIGERCQMLVCSVYKPFVLELQNLLYSMGILSRFKSLSKDLDHPNWQDKFGLYIVNNDDRELFNSLSSVGFKSFKISKCQHSSNSYPIEFFKDLETRPKNWHQFTSLNSKRIPYSTLNKFHKGSEKIKPIEITSIEEGEYVETYDLEVDGNHCFICDGVLVHNSATLCMFSHDDDEMLNAKIGDWFITNPQRGRSNNSAALLKGAVSREEFSKLIQSTKQFGEPGFIWVDDLEIGYNPCVEIGLYPKTIDGRSGFQGCNLTEINGKWCTSKENFMKACEASAIIGTLQAGYTDFKYLGEASKEIFDEEALLGCSITGMMDNPDILFDPDIQREGSKFILETNEKVAKMIGIKSCARSTAIKPAGSTSCILGTASGIHPHHAKRYIRRVQANKNEFCLQETEKVNPLAVEDSVWSTNKTDKVISFLCEVPSGAIVKNQLKAVELLERVKLTQQYWVNNGTVLDRCVNKKVRHNVSNTCFHRHERFPTTSGIKSFNDFSDGDSVEVFDYMGDPRKAIVKNFGKQELYDLVLSNGKTTKTIKTTKNHIWLVCNKNKKYSGGYKNHSSKFGYKMVTTDNLKYVKNCQIPKINTSQNRNLNYEAFCHGFVFGDGSKHYNREHGSTHVKIYDSCRSHIANIFKSIIPECSIIENEDNIYVGKLCSEWKKLPNDSVDCDYIFSFISGWFAADGYVASINDNQRSISITNKSEDNIKWLYDKAPIAGFSVNKPTTNIQTVGYNVGESYSNLTFVKSTMNDNFFIGHPDKYNRWLNQKQRIQNSEYFTVVSVKPTGVYDDVFCVVEPETSTFLLEDNILTHNCSVHHHEWDEVEKYIFDNQEWFAGISLLSTSGDLDYAQAPFATVLSPNELIKEYGDASVFASGLIVDGLHAFDQNLWRACDTVLGWGEDISTPPESLTYPEGRDYNKLSQYFIKKAESEKYSSKVDWVRRVNQFSERYFEGDLKKATYCLKHVSLWKTWCDLKREYKEVDWESLVEDHEYYVSADTLGAQACSGGKCELI